MRVGEQFPSACGGPEQRASATAPSTRGGRVRKDRVGRPSPRAYPPLLADKAAVALGGQARKSAVPVSVAQVAARRRLVR